MNKINQAIIKMYFFIKKNGHVLEVLTSLKILENGKIFLESSHFFSKECYEQYLSKKFLLLEITCFK